MNKFFRNRFSNLSKFAFYLSLFALLLACSSSGSDSTTITVTLSGTVSRATGGGQSNEATGITVTVTNLSGKSSVTDLNGVYSISEIPAAGTYTINAVDENAGVDPVICEIRIEDSQTMTVTNNGGTDIFNNAICSSTGGMTLNIIVP